ncbi:MAG: Arc family DNA-binding protein [Gemmatimonadota bacterium]
MPNLTIKNLGEPLLVQLREAAERNRRSLNSEVIRRLEASVGSAPADAAELLAQARSIRERARLPYLTDEAIRVARDEGRP